MSVLPSSFESRIIERQVGTCRLFILPSEVENVVSWRGSCVSNPVFEEDGELLQSLVVTMLDKGTRRRDRFQIADVLENRGAQLRFQDRGTRIGFSGRALRKDVKDVMDVMAEQLAEPLFDEQEFVKARMRIGASIQRSMESTSTQAAHLLRRQMYAPAHPNYTIAAPEELEALQGITLDALRAYHEAHFGGTDCMLVVVGDVDPDEIEHIVADSLGGWQPHHAPATFEQAARIQPPKRLPFPMPDKTNIDVRMGHPLKIRRDEEVYTWLHLGNYILGGNFSSRLMDIVRDEMGLTYGVSSSLAGITSRYEGHWQIGITLSEDKLDTGINATLGVLSDFVNAGVTASELADKKTTLTGTFKVQLATTSGLADTILRGFERGFGKDYLDRFPEWIDASTLDQVNASIKAHFHPDALHIAMAGSIPQTD